MATQIAFYDDLLRVLLQAFNGAFAKMRQQQSAYVDSPWQMKMHSADGKVLKNFQMSVLDVFKNLEHQRKNCQRIKGSAARLDELKFVYQATLANLANLSADFAELKKKNAAADKTLTQLTFLIKLLGQQQRDAEILSNHADQAIRAFNMQILGLGLTAEQLADTMLADIASASVNDLKPSSLHVEVPHLPLAEEATESLLDRSDEEIVPPRHFNPAEAVGYRPPVSRTNSSDSNASDTTIDSPGSSSPHSSPKRTMSLAEAWARASADKKTPPPKSGFMSKLKGFFWNDKGEKEDQLPDPDAGLSKQYSRRHSREG